jgi:isopenicillin N synthase-like dioxygenase
MNLALQTPVRSQLMHARDLQTHGFVRVEYYRPLRDAVSDAMSSWKKFCTLPLEQKRLLSGGDRIQDFGYMCRKDSGPKADDKELFHSLRAHFPQLLGKARRIGDKRATDFIDAVDSLIEQMQPLVHQFAGEVEEYYRLHDFTREVMASVDYWVFRYLRYPKAQPILANEHADRGGFTFHLGETEGGGEYFSFDRRWRPWPVSETETIIFPSMGLQYRSQNLLKALWHRVLPVESPTAERFSMVTFVDFQGTHRFNDSRFRMQNFEPGFNYDMPFDEFAKLFVPRLEMAPG